MYWDLSRLAERDCVLLVGFSAMVDTLDKRGIKCYSCFRYFIG